MMIFLAKAIEYLRARPWMGWAACILLFFPLGYGCNALNAVRAELKACQDAQMAADKAEVVQKMATNSSVRVKITPSPDGLAANSSWPTPCPEVLVEASSEASTERIETPKTADSSRSQPTNGLSAGIGYQEAPYACVRLQTGKIGIEATIKPSGSWGAGADYRFWSW